MSLVKSFGSLTLSRSYVSVRSLHPKKFTSILNDVPTRPSNPWQIYLRENMNQYKNASGKTDLKIATKTLGAKWKSLSDHEKEPFIKTYKKESEEHAKKMEQALKNATPKQFKEENGLRKKYGLTLLKDPRAPKRPKNNFMYYLDHLRETNDPLIAGNDVTVQVSAAAKKFKTLSPTEKKVYQDKANAANDQYKRDMEAYNESAKL